MTHAQIVASSILLHAVADDLRNNISSTQRMGLLRLAGELLPRAITVCACGTPLETSVKECWYCGQFTAKLTA